MIGAIAGDIIGSIYERHPITTTDFPLFDIHCRYTDDTVLTVALADAILSGVDYGAKLKEYYRLYPDRGFGGGFRKWAAHHSHQPHVSMGNGSAMRVSPIGFTFGSLQQVLEEAKRSAEPSHNHPEGIKGAQAVAAAVFLARTGATKECIKAYVAGTFGYDLDQTLQFIRLNNRPDNWCPSSVPQAITAFLLSEDYEDAVRKAVSMGGDADTVACISGGIAQAYYKVIPDEIVNGALNRLDEHLTKIVKDFRERYLKDD
ncbi:MAG: ADP-ribosylglycohydrolase family protein [Syntrophorhabdales bacterium]|jgi:ADP-ribosylglycohydrolase